MLVESVDQASQDSSGSVNNFHRLSRFVEKSLLLFRNHQLGHVGTSATIVSNSKTDFKMIVRRVTAGWFVNLCVQEEATILRDELFPGCRIAECLTRRREDAKTRRDILTLLFATSRLRVTSNRFSNREKPRGEPASTSQADLLAGRVAARFDDPKPARCIRQMLVVGELSQRSSTDFADSHRLVETRRYVVRELA